ncbi:MAG: DUF2752 domain-containing protein [Phycisphaerales bacterium JB038]
MTDASSQDNAAELAPLPRLRLGRQGRVLALVISLGCLTVLLLAAGLRADASGAGTHEQIGLPPCGFLTVTGKPCATCGMTTAFAYAAEGKLITAFLTQPMGLALALLAATAVWAGGYAALTGAPIQRLYAPLLKPRVVWAIVLLFLAAWGYKVLTY